MTHGRPRLRTLVPAGMDKGKGGKYLILPPGYKEHVPSGYIPMPSATYQSYALLRSNLKSSSDADIATAVAYRQTDQGLPAFAGSASAGYAIHRRHRCSLRRHYSPMTCASLSRSIAWSRWSLGWTVNRAMIDPLKSIGIEKGKPFNPDAANQDILKRSALEAHAWFQPLYEAAFIPPFNEGTHWALPVSPDLQRPSRQTMLTWTAIPSTPEVSPTRGPSSAPSILEQASTIS